MVWVRGEGCEVGAGTGVTSQRREASFVLDDRQRIVQWSYGAAALTGTPEAQAIGRPCYEVFHGYDAFGRPICRSSCPV
ncbi:MAG: PAS domain-containing protein, partial [Chloroflexi bacterium]|nr:PAS domain-containing protein [Chloroflexota bacterium]